MIGSTIIYAPKPEKLVKLKENFESLNDLTRVELDTLMTLDFVEIAQEGKVKWNEKEPVLYDEEGGIAVFGIQPEALEYVIKYRGDLDPLQEEDLKKLKGFVKQYGKLDIYEMSTF